MSTIVVVKKAGKVCIAADSLTSFGDLSMGSDYDADSDKILQCDGAYLGIVGSAAHHLVMQSIIQQPEIKMDFSTRMTIFESFRQLHPMLKEKYFLNAKDEDDDPYESTQIDALIASPHGIFGVHSLREVCEYKKFWAIGSGSEYALGAMFALYDSVDSVDKIAQAGVRAGAEFNNATAMPMTSYTLDLVKLKAATG
jgi:ATP-dependent protease HslVU (ClpYQ) peptidase subunit